MPDESSPEAHEYDAQEQAAAAALQRHAGWECLRCRGFFFDRNDALGTSKKSKLSDEDALARFQRQACDEFGSELCSKCLSEEYEK
jgi:hypothetical protein